MTNAPGIHARSVKLGNSVALRNSLLLRSVHRLRRIALEQIELGRSSLDFVLLCIKVDARLRPMVEALIPSEDWDELQVQEGITIACGAVKPKISDYLIKMFPELKGVVDISPEPPLIKIIVLDGTGCTVYKFDPYRNSSVQ